jgi:pimeloyl-ACP methyl ester carboxylesterase
VVLDAGAGDSSIEWALVQPEVARFARVCSYDRSGSGWSDLGPYPHTGRQIVYELRTLLANAGEVPPYVLVGHSMGGRYARMFASAYRELVAGLVLVDASHEDDLLNINGKLTRLETATRSEIPPVKMSTPLRLEDLPTDAQQAIAAATRQANPQTDRPPYSKLPSDARAARVWAWSQLKHFAANNSPFDGDEALALRAERQNARQPLGDLPLVIVTRGQPLTGPLAEQRDAERKQHQTELASLSSAGRQVIARNSGHHIHIDELAVVIEAVRDVIARSVKR